jgi:hypothetical protein
MLVRKNDYKTKSKNKLKKILIGHVLLSCIQANLGMKGKNITS